MVPPQAMRPVRAHLQTVHPQAAQPRRRPGAMVVRALSRLVVATVVTALRGVARRM